MAHELLTAARSIAPQTIELRRSLHRHPEVGNDLPKTRARVLGALSDLPLEVTAHATTSGLVARLDGERPGASVLLRGDMDALPMPEDTGLDYASEHDGAMHACGHDLHTAMLASAARLLSERTAEMAGSVLFMFQPGEEGHHGARYMLDEGLFDPAEPPMGAFALHVTTLYPSGSVNHRPGPLLASADEIEITVTGRGGHASAPHLAFDPIPVAAEIVLAIQTAVTRRFSVFDPVVVTIGKIDGGTTQNVIPESARLLGTIRALSDTNRRNAQEMVERVATNVARAHGVEADLEIRAGYPITVNDEAFAARVTRVATEVVGDDAVVPMPDPIMGAEDWSYVLEQVPGAMAFLGACPPDAEPGFAPNMHSNRVMFDEEAMHAGVALHAAVALDVLAQP